MTQRAVTTPLALAVAALEQREDRLVDAGVERAVETASQQAAEELVSPDTGTDQLTALLKNALASEPVEGGGSTDGDERQQLAAAIQDAVDDAEFSLSTDDCEALAGGFLASLRGQLCTPLDGEASVDTPLQRLGDSALRSGGLADAESYFQLAVDCAREHDAKPAEAAGLRSLGNVALQREELEAAEEFHRESLDIAREVDLQSVEADSLASLGSIEASRGYPETAETYLTESLDLKRLLGDEFGEATCLATLGNVAEGREDYQTAVENYSDALELFGPENTRERLETLQGLITAERELGDVDAAREHCEQGRELLSDTELPGGDAYDRWFRTTEAQLSGDSAAIRALYETALEHLRTDDRLVAYELLEGLWGCREAVDTESESFELSLRAGVGFVALHRLADHESVDGDQSTVVDAIDPHRERLSEPSTRLFELLVSEDAGEVAELDRSLPDGEDPSLTDLEQLAYSVLAESLMETPQATEWYGTALSGLLDGRKEPKQVLKTLLATWNKRDVDGATRAVVGAGLVAEAHRELFDVELPTDRQTVLDVARDSDQLSEPLVALRNRLEGESVEPPAAPDSLAGQLSVIEVETAAVDRIIRQLDS